MKIVDINGEIDYNLNHIYKISLGTTAIVSGQSQSVANVTQEFFKKSLILTSDLKRIPVLRGYHIEHQCGPAMKSKMGAANVETCVLNTEVYRGLNQQDEDSLFGLDSIFFKSDVDENTALNLNNIAKSYGGGIIMPRVINVNLIITCSTPTATDNISASFGFTRIWLELDWVAVTKAKFHEWLMENVYVDED